MKKKHFTKSDRLWLYTLLKLVKNTAKISNNASDARCSKPEKNKKSQNPIVADIIPRLGDLSLSTNLEEYSEEIDDLEKVICKIINNANKKRVTFAENTNGCGDTCSEKCCSPLTGILKKHKTDIDMAKDIFVNQNIQKHSVSFNGREMASSSVNQSLETLANRLDNLKKDSFDAGINRVLGGNVNISGKNVTKALNPKIRKTKPHYELTKDSVRHIPFAFLTEIKDVVPGGVGEMIEKHAHRKASKSGTYHYKKKQVIDNSTRLSSNETINNFGKVSNNSLKDESKTLNTAKKTITIGDKTNLAVKKVATNYRDVPSRFGENYKRITMALETKKIGPCIEQLNETIGGLNIADSLEDLQSVIQGKKHVITVDVDKKRTKALKSKYYVGRMTLPKTNRQVPDPFKSDKASKNNNIEQVGECNSLKEKKPREEKDRAKHSGCECYLTSFFKHREAYLDRFGLKCV